MMIMLFVFMSVNLWISLFQKHLGNSMAEFNVELMSHWSDEAFTVLSESGTAMDAADEDFGDEVIEDANEN